MGYVHQRKCAEECEIRIKTRSKIGGKKKEGKNKQKEGEVQQK
ncbi:hypothetical protein [Methanosarcina horonobensis]|nr:hypothetical protein [Methanosarcina horonobensis]